MPANEMGTTGGGRVGFGVRVRGSASLDTDDFECTVEHSRGTLSQVLGRVLNCERSFIAGERF